MITEEVEIKELQARLSYWVVQIRMNNGNYLYDGNKLAESLVLKLLNLLYDLNLKDINEEKANAPGIDLGDKAAGVAFQVSSRTDANKVIDTLRKANTYKFAADYPNGIRFFVLSDGGKFEFKKIKPADILSTFDEKRDLVYLEDVAKRIKTIYETDEIKFRAIKELLEKEIRYPEQDPSSIQSQIATMMALVKSQMQQEAEKAAVRPFSVDEAFDADLSIPHVSLISQRSATVGELLAGYESQPLLWLYGGIGTGKSGLAFLIAKHFDPSAVWIDLRDQPAEEAVTKTVSLLCANFTIEQQKSLKATVELLASRLPKNGLLIINDLPSLAGKERVRQQLELFLQTFLNAGIRVLVTSNFAPFAGLQALLSARLRAMITPAFSKEETAEVLQFYGASEDFITENCALVTTITDGHALLVHTAARYLAEHRWNMSDEVFTALFKNNFGQEYTAEVYARILDSTQDEETKLLLYRMGLIMGAFTDREITLVGNVVPTINQTHERAQRLKGTWIQELEKGRYQLSPLIKRLDHNLPPEVQNSLSEALGDDILKKGKISQLEAGDTLLYYLKAKAYVKLSWALLRVLEESLKNTSLFFDWGFDWYWYRTPLPNEIPALLRAMIRSFHLQLSTGRQEETAFLAADLEDILKTEEVGLIARGFSELMISHVYLKTDPVKSLRYFLMARKSMTALDEQIPGSGVEPIFQEDLLWTSFYSLRTRQQFEEWFELFKTIRNELNTEDIEVLAPYVVAGHSLVRLTVLQEGETPEQALDTLRSIHQHALGIGLPLIAVYALRYSISIHGIYQQNAAIPEQYIADNTDLLASKPIYNYLIREEYGRQLYFAGEKEAAFQQLSEVIEVPIPKPFIEGVDGFRVYAQLLGEQNPKAAHQFSEKALDKVLNDPTHDETFRIKILAEAGISSWLIGRKQEALCRLADANERLLKCYSETEEHQATLIRLAHVANYIRGELIEGKAPQKTADGGKYAEPVRGLFFFDYTELLKGGFYFPERKFMSTVVFEEVFEFFNDYAQARKWALLGIEHSLSLPNSQYFPILLKALGYLIIDRHYTKTVNLYLYVEGLLDKIREQSRQGNDVGVFEHVKHLLASGENDAFFYQQVVIPITVTIAHDILSGKLPEEEYKETIECLFEILRPAVKDGDSLRFAHEVYQTVLVNRISDNNLDGFLSTYTGPYHSQVTTIAYLLQGLFTDAVTAARHQLSIALTLDFFQKLLPPFYRFELVSFLDAFWVKKFDQYPRQVKSISFWHEKSLPHMRKAATEDKLRKLFQTVVHHLEVQLSQSLEEWIYR